MVKNYQQHIRSSQLNYKLHKSKEINIKRMLRKEDIWQDKNVKPNSNKMQNFINPNLFNYLFLHFSSLCSYHFQSFTFALLRSTLSSTSPSGHRVRQPAKIQVIIINQRPRSRRCNRISPNLWHVKAQIYQRKRSISTREEV